MLEHTPCYAIIYRVNNLYGRKDAGFNFQTDLVNWMKMIGFIQNMFDRALFRREATKTEQKIECVIWTDDFLASVKSEADAAWLKRKVEDRWAPGGKSVKFEHATFFLGANIEQCDTHTLELARLHLWRTVAFVWPSRGWHDQEQANQKFSIISRYQGSLQGWPKKTPLS